MAEGQFETRLRCAVAAGWWTVLIGVLWLTVAWLVWLLILGSPRLIELVGRMWGGVELAQMKQITVAFFGLFKIAMGFGLMVVIFLTIWSRKLRKAS